MKKKCRVYKPNMQDGGTNKISMTQDSQSEPIHEEKANNFVNWLHTTSNEAQVQSMIEADSEAINQFMKNGGNTNGMLYAQDGLSYPGADVFTNGEYTWQNPQDINRPKVPQFNIADESQNSPLNKQNIDPAYDPTNYQAAPNEMQEFVPGGPDDPFAKEQTQGSENPYFFPQAVIAGTKAVTGLKRGIDRVSEEQYFNDQFSDVFNYNDVAGSDRGDYMANVPGIGDFLKPDQNVRKGYNTKTAQDGIAVQDNTRVDSFIPDFSNMKIYDPTDVSYRQTDGLSPIYTNTLSLEAEENLLKLNEAVGKWSDKDEEIAAHKRELAEYHARMKPEVRDRYYREKQTSYIPYSGGLISEPDQIPQYTAKPFPEIKQQGGEFNIAQEGRAVQDNTRVAPPHIPQGTIEEQMAEAELRKQQLEELSGPYTAIATPDYNSTFPNDSVRFFPGQRGSKVPYIRDLGNLAGVTGEYSSDDYLNMVNHGNARMYQDTSRVEANPDYMFRRQDGGEFNIDDEVELSEAQINNLISQGYNLEYLD